METEVAPVTFHCSVDELPMAMLLGVAEKVSMAATPAGGLTITVACEVTEPYMFDAVSVYIVVAEGVIVMVLDSGTSPIPLSIKTLSALLTFHCMVAELPLFMTGGLISKKLIRGRTPGGTVG